MKRTDKIFINILIEFSKDKCLDNDEYVNEKISEALLEYGKNIDNPMMFFIEIINNKNVNGYIHEALSEKLASFSIPSKLYILVEMIKDKNYKLWIRVNLVKSFRKLKEVSKEILSQFFNIFNNMDDYFIKLELSVCLICLGKIDEKIVSFLTLQLYQKPLFHREDILTALFIVDNKNSNVQSIFIKYLNYESISVDTKCEIIERLPILKQNNNDFLQILINTITKENYNIYLTEILKFIYFNKIDEKNILDILIKVIENQDIISYTREKILKFLSKLPLYELYIFKKLYKNNKINRMYFANTNFVNLFKRYDEEYNILHYIFDSALLQNKVLYIKENHLYSIEKGLKIKTSKEVSLKDIKDIKIDKSFIF